MLRLTEHEWIEQCHEDLDELVKDYFAKTIAKENTPPLEFNWPAYMVLQSSGNLVLVTTRDGEALVGFVTYFVMPHLHHMKVLCAQCDMLATRVGHRGQSIGRNLVRWGEYVLRRMGVKQITHNFRTCYDTEPLFPKLGYKLDEHCYRKML